MPDRVCSCPGAGRSMPDWAVVLACNQTAAARWWTGCRASHWRGSGREVMHKSGQTRLPACPTNQRTDQQATGKGAERGRVGADAAAERGSCACLREGGGGVDKKAERGVRNSTVCRGRRHTGGGLVCAGCQTAGARRDTAANCKAVSGRWMLRGGCSVSQRVGHVADREESLHWGEGPVGHRLPPPMSASGRMGARKSG